MLALKNIPEHYRQWNETNGAPFGFEVIKSLADGNHNPRETETLLRGPFSLQKNNTTREFEYPWAFHTANLMPGMRVIEIGGGLSGFQFVISKHGCNIVNVDPGLSPKCSAWKCDRSSMDRLNTLFKTNVTLINSTIEHACLADCSCDCAFSISVVEHLSKQAAQDVMRQVYRILRPGGIFVLTIDLFLDLVPFTSRKRNNYGWNQNVQALCESEPWKIEVGNPSELFGFDTFDERRIESRLSEYLIGRRHPVLVQCLVLRKPAQAE